MLKINTSVPVIAGRRRKAGFGLESKAGCRMASPGPVPSASEFSFPRGGATRSQAETRLFVGK